MCLAMTEIDHALQSFPCIWHILYVPPIIDLVLLGCVKNSERWSLILLCVHKSTHLG